MINKILLVGGTGYIGRHLEEALKNADFEVHITGTINRNEKNYHRILFADEMSFQSLSGKTFDLMIILASKLDALGTTQLNHIDLKTNVTSYANFLEYAAQYKLTKRIIYTSSMTVYGNQNKLPVEENGIINPVSTYGLSKYMAEIISSFYCNHHGVNGIGLRLPGIYGGERKSGYIYDVLTKCAHNEDITLYSNNLLYWETININDLCNIMLRFIEAYDWKAVFQTFNVSYGEEIDFYETCYLIKSLLKSRSVITETGLKGYVPFYMSNTKMQRIIQINESFKTSLNKYLLSIS